MKFSSDAYIVVYESRELYFAVHNSFILWKMLISLSLDVQFWNSSVFKYQENFLSCSRFFQNQNNKKIPQIFLQSEVKNSFFFQTLI